MIEIPGSQNNTFLEQYLCPETGTLPPDTKLVLSASQTIPPGRFCLIENTTNLTITAPVPVTVQCMQDASNISNRRGFGFFNVTNLLIENIRFDRCGGTITLNALRYVNDSVNLFYFYGPGQRTTLLFNHCFDLNLSSVTVSAYFGYAVIGVNLCGVVDFSNVLQTQVNTSLGIECSIGPSDFDLVGSGTFLYFVDSKVSEYCENTRNTLFVGLASEGHVKYCSYLEFYNDLLLRQATSFPISSGSSLGFVYAQSKFKVKTVFDLLMENNKDDFLGSTLLLLPNLETESSVTLTGKYQHNHGLLMKVFFYFFCLKDCKRVSPFSYHPLKLENLTFVSNNLPDFGYTIDIQAQNEHTFSVNKYIITLENISWIRNSQPILLNAKQAYSGDSSLQIALKNITALENNQSLTESTLVFGTVESDKAAFSFMNMANITFLSDVYLSADLCGSCVQMTFSSIYLTGQNITFANGFARYGGALQLDDYDSYIHIVEPANILFVNNRAREGAAVYASDQFRVPGFPYSDFRMCTILFNVLLDYTQQNLTKLNVTLNFVNNRRGSTFVSLYLLNTLCTQVATEGFTIDPTEYNVNKSLFLSTELNMHIFKFDNNFDALLSFPNGICYSLLSSPQEFDFNCTWTDKGLSKFGDETFSRPVFGSLSTYPGKIFLHIYYEYKGVYSTSNPHNGTWRLNTHSQLLQIYGGVNPIISFSVSNYTGGSEFYLYLFPGSFYTSQYNSVQLALVHVLECPIGFTLTEEVSHCDCIPLLAKNNITCDINSGLITLPDNFWVGGVRDDNETVGFVSDCPPTRCNSSTQVDLEIPDFLCVNHHTGIICGDCAPGYSVVFGSDSCQPCSNAWIMTIFLYGLAGILFVFILFALNLTTSSGTICGLVIYVNILGLTVETLLDSNNSDVNPQPLVIFVSMLNLDLGFPICFYDGMTVPAKVGMQFVFPVYLWLLVIGLIVACKFSSRLANKIGFASVQVLATLIFFSYSKILTNVYTIFTFQTLSVGDQETVSQVAVWFYNGKPFAEAPHLVLMIVAVIFTLLFLIPFTFILTFAFFLVRYRYVNKFRPLIDAYSGPFETKFRFWFGVRLWLIFLLFLIYTSLRGYDSSILYLSHSIVVMGIIVCQAIFKPFKDRFCRALDLFYLINYWLIVTTAIYLSKPNQIDARTKVTTFLVSCGFVAFVGILVYQFYQVTKDTRLFRALRQKLPTWRIRNSVAELKSINGSSPNTGSVKYQDLSEETNKQVYSRQRYDPSRFRDSILNSQ